MPDATATTVNGSSDTSGEPLRFAVMHRTRFRYDSPVTDSLNTLHLQPRMFLDQEVLSAKIRVLPLTRVLVFADFYQNVVHHFELPNPHLKLDIESRFVVEKQPLELSDESLEAGVSRLADEGLSERVWTFLQDSRRVRRTPEIWRQAIDVTADCDAVFAKATALMNWLHAEFSHDSGATGVNADVSAVFELRRGVCQDFAHVMIGMCRALELPARIASGYLHNGLGGNLVGSQASHAWCEVYLPGAGWVGFDPTNDTLADERYIKVAVGRDYEDVAPVTSSFSGAGGRSVDVRVEVTCK